MPPSIPCSKPSAHQAALDVRGKIAIATCMVIYAKFRDLFSGAGAARLQRLHWFDTGTRNPAYSDVRYVEELIGPDTATILPPATLAAFRGHGRVRGVTLSEGLDGRSRPGADSV